MPVRSYYIWTVGCQMNKAESQRIADYLGRLDYQPAATPENADLIVLNTCVVRQSAEDKVIGTLGYLKGINTHRRTPTLVTGCFVDSNTGDLKDKFPHVDLFFRPGALDELSEWAQKQGMTEVVTAYPQTSRPRASVLVPIIQGCNNFCSYCIVPYRRGREHSRLLADIVCEVSALAKAGTKEIILLGQNVDSYGHDLPTRPDLSCLLTQLNHIDGLARIRFLTNHPKDMSPELITAIASLDSVCEHITLPVQSGDNDILKAMRRGYTVEQYRDLVAALRSRIPQIALSTDVIVGFPGETDQQFNRSLKLIQEIKFDTVHIAAYSPRPGTIASKEYDDNIPLPVKKERLHAIETLQTEIAADINDKLRGRTVEILVENRKKGKWYGRTRSDKLVFFEHGNSYHGQLVKVTISHTGPWSMQGEMATEMTPGSAAVPR